MATFPFPDAHDPYLPALRPLEAVHVENEEAGQLLSSL